MKKYSLNRGWQYTEGELRNPLMMNMLGGWRKCHLPHDYQIGNARDLRSLTADNEGWTQGAALFYKKEFVMEPETSGKRCWLEFEGIAGVCEIWVNGQYLAKHMNPYTGVVAEATRLVHPGENVIQVHVDSRMKPNSRWYVGTGLYRRVWLHLGEQAAVLPETLHAATKALEGNRAVLGVTARLTAPADAVTFSLKDKNGILLAEAAGQLDGTAACAELTAEGVTPWCPGTPELYTVEAAVIAGGVTDTAAVRTGIRTISVDPEHGFRLNGVPMKLKGGCIHHDLGILGAAEHAAADRRRIQILLDNGYNAVRGAHNPFGPAFYEACDELGMLVIEEAFDEWVMGRTDFGLHITFEDRWERDLEDMIRRDYNHPSIIMWSTGNEVEERDGSAGGFAWSRRLADKVRSLDGSRPVSASACSLFVEYTQRPGPGAGKGVTGNQALNMAYDAFAEGRDLWGPGTADYFAPLDVAGYNYKSVRYEYDHEKFPDRVIYGSESYPRAALQSWQAAQRNPHVIGDFVWTAWEYIGEVGGGRWEVTDEERPSDAKYPWLLAYQGDMDLLGNKRPQSYYRDFVWKRGGGPRLFCLPPELVGKHIARLSWGWLPVRRSYTFAGCEGWDVEVHIYADADEVELLQNGVSMGRLPCTEAQEYTAVFTVPYVPGRLEAVSYTNGLETGRDVLQTAGEAAALSMCADRPVIAGDGDDLAFVTIRALDADGVHVFDETGEVTVRVLGGGELLALGAADPKPDRVRLFAGERCPLFEGTAMAVIHSERGAKGCMVEASLGEITARLPIGFTAVEEPAAPVHDVKPGPLDLPLGELMADPGAMEVLKTYLAPIVDNPMVSAMQGMSLKKIFSISRMSAPDGLEQALNKLHTRMPGAQCPGAADDSELYAPFHW